MAYYLQFDDTNDVVNLTSSIVLSGDFTIEIDGDFLESASSTAVRLIDQSSSNNNFIQWFDTDAGGSVSGVFRVRINGSTYDFADPFPTRTQGRTLFTIIRTGTTLELYVDDPATTPTETFTGVTTSNFTINTISDSAITINGGVYGVRFYNNVGTLIHDYDPSASNGTGSTLKDTTVNANDGTLVNFPVDDSQWVFYSGGGGTAQAIAIVNSNQGSTPTPTNLSASLAVNTIASSQTNSAPQITLDANQLIGVISALQACTATPVNLTQSGSQDLAIINAIQQNSTQLLSIEQQQALGVITSNQVNNAGLIGIESAQAVSFISASQSNAANPLNLEQFSGQIITIIAAQQTNTVQTVLISQIDSVDLLDATQANTAQLLDISQSADLSVISAGQVSTTNLLNIISSGDNTDLTGLTLTPVTNIYTLSTTKNIYTLEKQ